MLEEILQKMYVEPELLELLPESDKQILFYKIRQEQIRRYNEHEAQLEKVSPMSDTYSPRTCFRAGEDGKVWVWVMGEHQNDESIESIIEREALKKAEQQAAEEFQRIELEESSKTPSPLPFDEPDKPPSPPPPNKAEASSKLLFTKRMPPPKPTNAPQSTPAVVLRARGDPEARRQAHINRRSCELMNSFQQIRAQFDHEAQAQQPQLDQGWREREKRAKQAEKEAQEMARLARAKSARVALTVVNAMNALHKGIFEPRVVQNPPSTLPPSKSEPPKPVTVSKSKVVPPPPPRPKQGPAMKPLDPSEVLHWFRTTQLSRRDFVENGEHGPRVALWFHGLLSQESVERRLESAAPNTFLVRLNERVCGFMVSYRSQTRVKHLLVRVEQDDPQARYQVLGLLQETPGFHSLQDLVQYYKSHSLSPVAEEFLLYPLPQDSPVPDYQALLEAVSEDSVSTKL